MPRSKSQPSGTRPPRPLTAAEAEAAGRSLRLLILGELQRTARQAEANIETLYDKLAINGPAHAMSLHAMDALESEVTLRILTTHPGEIKIAILPENEAEVIEDRVWQHLLSSLSALGEYAVKELVDMKVWQHNSSNLIDNVAHMAQADAYAALARLAGHLLMLHDLGMADITARTEAADAM